jgi:hypothetical protein
MPIYKHSHPGRLKLLLGALDVARVREVGNVDKVALGRAALGALEVYDVLKELLVAVARGEEGVAAALAPARTRECAAATTIRVYMNTQQQSFLSR